MNSEAILIGGESGGKSTFIGGLMYYLIERSDLDPTFNYVYNRDFIWDEIYHRMERDNEYPPKTGEKDAYLLEISFSSGSLFPNEYTFEIMDFPGEYQYPEQPDGSVSEYLRRYIPFKQSNGEAIRETYEEVLHEKLANDKQPTDEEWKQIFKHRYSRSDTAICILNLHKLVNSHKSMPVLIDGEENILSVAEGKSRKLVLVTACDVIDYDPGEFDGDGQSIISTAVRDRTLAEKLLNEDWINDEGARQDLKRCLEQVRRNNSGFSFFGVSVPAVDPQRGDEIRPGQNGYGFEVRGFETVVKWLIKERW